MGWKSRLRWGAAASILATLFAFFAPIIPYSTRVICSGLYGNCPNNGHYTGFNSIALALFNWGGSYSSQSHGYYFSTLVLGPYQYLIGTTGYTTSFIIPGLAIILLSLCSLVILLSPEIVDGTYYLSTVVSEKLGRGI